MSNGTNGHSHHDGAAPGLWFVVIEAGVGYLVRTVEDVTEEDVTEAWATNGYVKFTAKTIIALDGIRGAKADENRTPEVFTLPIVQKLANRIGFQDDFVAHVTAHSFVLISKMTPANKAHVAATIDRIEKAELEARAKRAGISLPAR